MEKNPRFWKEFVTAFFLFVLPFSSYLHLFFVDYPSDSVLEISSQKWIGLNIDVFIYYILKWISYSLLFFIWWKSLRTSYRNFVLLYIVVIFIQSDLLLIRIPHLSNVNELTILLISFSSIYIFSYIKVQFEFLTIKAIKFKTSIFPILFFLSVFISFVFVAYPKKTDSLTFLFLEIEANHFIDAATNLYMITYKFSMLSALLLWFFTEKKWYKYALLSSIIILTNQLYNMLWIEGDILDEFELRESGAFLFSVLLGLILISHAAHNQAKIRSFMYKVYNDVERTIVHRFKTRQNYINTKRKEFNNAKNSVEELKKVKEQLEKAIGK